MYTNQQRHQERVATSLIKRLEESYYEDRIDLKAEACVFSPPRPFAERLAGEYRSVQAGDVWGQAWEVAWFHVQATVPSDWQGKAVIAKLDLEGEICIYDDEGCPVNGLTATSIYFPNFLHDRHPVLEAAAGGEAVDLWFEASATRINGIHRDEDPPADDPKRHGHYEATVRELSLRVFNRSLWHLFLDANVLYLQLEALPENAVRRRRLARALCDAADAYVPEDAGTIDQARGCLAPLLADPAAKSDLATQAVGHAHIDTAWLWPVAESVRKCARTFSRQIRLLDTYPDYVFGASQAQHYAFVKEHYPQLFERIREKVAAGRWELQGGMWVEPDCNLIGGESMVRQLLHGMRFFQAEFGTAPRNLWLPDVFGYSAALPQLLRQCGIGFLVTQKLCWNLTNRVPHHTFRWRGLDGSEVLVHFPPEDTYNSLLNPARLAHARDNFEENAFLPEFLTLFGLGDGGGGPTEEALETGLRQRNLEGSPQVRFGTAQDFLDRLEDRRDELGLWDGELYLERHRGTLTTQARIKQENRQLELLLRAVELVWSSAPAAVYPHGRLDRLWEKLLLNQFHDILPGSSIRQVYEDTCRDYAWIREEATALLDAFRTGELQSEAERHLLFNPLSCPTSGSVTLPRLADGTVLADEAGNPLPCQHEGNTTLIAVNLPGLGQATLRPVPGTAQEPALTETETPVLENDLIRYEFDPGGRLVRAWDKEAGIEYLAPGMVGNELMLYEDRNIFSTDAWDLDVQYEARHREAAALTGAIRHSAGPVRQSLHWCLRVGASTLLQTVCLHPDSRRLDFVTEADWQERHKLLRVNFAVDVRADFATFETQFGALRRATHSNTSWDYARYEVCGHRFADLSQADRGVALLNDCKYGYRAHDNVLSLTLLRSPTYPDADADMGAHRFTYSLLPHAADFAAAPVLPEALCLNQAPLFWPETAAAAPLACCTPPEADNIVLAAVKRAGAPAQDLVIRLYEAKGLSTTTALRFLHPVAAVREADLLERPGTAVELTDGAVELHFRPFAVKTLLVRQT